MRLEKTEGTDEGNAIVLIMRLDFVSRQGDRALNVGKFECKVFSAS